MQDNFLFDSDKQRGIGVDRLGTKKDGLKLKWIWGNKFYSWTEKDGTIPSQICTTELGYFTLEVIFWHTYYEAELRHIDGTLKSIGDNDNKIILTRIDGQKIAEKLLREHYDYTKKILDKYFI